MIPEGFGDYWLNSMEAGRLSWNNSAAPVTFLPPTWVVRTSRFDGSLPFYPPIPLTGNYVRVEPNFDIHTVALLGLALSNVQYPAAPDRARVTLFLHGISSNSSTFGSSIPDIITHVMVHELGHVLGLDDGNVFRDGARTPVLGSNVYGSVMNHPNTAWGPITSPTGFDIDSVKMIYD